MQIIQTHTYTRVSILANDKVFVSFCEHYFGQSNRSVEQFMPDLFFFLNLKAVISERLSQHLTVTRGQISI